MINSNIYIGNDSILSLKGLKDRAGNLVTNAVVTLESFLDRRGQAVGGVPVPGNFGSASSGDYELLLSRDADISAGKIYYATIKAVSPSGLQGKWTETIIAKARAA